MTQQEEYSISTCCELLGYTRQAYYKGTKEPNEEEDILISSIVHYCYYLRQENYLPKAGARELYYLCKEHFKEKMTFGRDKFYEILRANKLMLKKKRFRPKTTDSSKSKNIYQDLLNIADNKRLKITHVGQMIVGDITYVACKEGWAYLSLLTDAYSRYIVGFQVYHTLEKEGPMLALAQAISFFKKQGIPLKGMIHHSDRGSQYLSGEYTDMLKKESISISTTQCGEPLHNALAERMNNTIKNSWYVSSEEFSFDEVCQRIKQAIYMYNMVRPHSAIDFKTPFQCIENNPINSLIAV